MSLLRLPLRSHSYNHAFRLSNSPTFLSARSYIFHSSADLKPSHCRSIWIQTRISTSPPSFSRSTTTLTSIPLRAITLWTIPLVSSSLCFHLFFTPRITCQALQENRDFTHLPFPRDLELDREHKNQKSSRTVFAHALHLLQIYIYEPLMTTGRFLKLMIIFLPVIIAVPMIYFGSPQPVQGNERLGALMWYDLLVLQMERAGPTFIKLGQWAASRADIFPTELCDRLSRLHSRVDPHPYRDTRAAIEQAFGMPIDQVFEELEMVPIGVGAIAQVYRGRLRPELARALTKASAFSEGDNYDSIEDDEVITKVSDDFGQDAVAIKVLHPRARKVVARDLRIMAFFAQLLHAIPTMEWLSFPDEVEQFGYMMQNQLDLRVEAANLVRFRRNFRKRYNCSFPKPLLACTTRDILIEEYRVGVPLEKFLDMALEVAKGGYGEAIYDKKIAEVGLNAFLNMLILDNWIHSDLHPGNMLVTFYKPSTTSAFRHYLARITHTHIIDDSNVAVHHILDTLSDPVAMTEELKYLQDEGYQPQIIFLDAGLATMLNDKNRRDFLDLFQALASFDGKRAGELMVERCRTPELVVNPQVFTLKIQDLVLSIRNKTFALAKIHIASLLQEVMTAVREHHVRLEGDFINVVLSILLLEGIGRRLDPDLDLFAGSAPILRKLGVEEGKKGVKEGVKEVRVEGWWFKLWLLIEIASFFSRSIREEEWMTICDLKAISD